MKKYIPFLFLPGCKTSSLVSDHTKSFTDSITEAQEPETLTVLSVAGGLCLIAGMILLVVTSGKKGWYPVFGGIGLVILNYLVAKYDDFIFYPLVVCTAAISAAWTYRTVIAILKEKRTYDCSSST